MTKGAFNSKIHLVVNEYGILINFIITNGAFGDCKKTILLIENINAKPAFTACICDADEILSYIKKQNIKPFIPPKLNWLYQHDYKCFNEKR